MGCKRLFLLSVVALQYTFVSSYCCLGSSPESLLDDEKVNAVGALTSLQSSGPSIQNGGDEPLSKSLQRVLSPYRVC